MGKSIGMNGFHFFAKLLRLTSGCIGLYLRVRKICALVEPSCVSLVSVNLALFFINPAPQFLFNVFK